jgi:tRNA 2-thiouridine synthesizing protein E
MPDIKKIIDNPDTPSPRRSDRELDLKDWDEAQAQNTAGQEGIELTDEHWEVVRYLREYYLEQGPPENGRELSDTLDDHYAEQGRRKYLRRLFPQGPVAQGMRTPACRCHRLPRTQVSVSAADKTRVRSAKGEEAWLSNIP